MNSKNLPRFSRIHWKNGKLEQRWHLGTSGIIRLWHEFSEFTLFFWNEFIKKWKIGVKIGYDNLGYIPLTVWILKTYPVFLEFIEIRIEDRVKDWTWKITMYSTHGMNSLELIRKKGKIRDVPSYILFQF